MAVVCDTIDIPEKALYNTSQSILIIQNEQLTLLDEEGHPSLFAPIMIATLSTCAQLERDNFIKLQNKRKSHCVYA